MIFRWFMPALYLACMICIAWGAVEDERRIRLAQIVAAALHEHPPASVHELETLLGGRLGERRETRRDPNGARRTGYALRPQVWLHLAVVFEQDSERIHTTELIYAASEELPLDDPASGLPRSGLATVYMAVIAAMLSAVWFICTRQPDEMGFFAVTIALITVVPIIPYGFGAALSLFRVMM